LEKNRRNRVTVGRGSKKGRNDAALMRRKSGGLGLGGVHRGDIASNQRRKCRGKGERASDREFM